MMIQKPIQQEEEDQSFRTYTQFIEQVRQDGDREIKQTIKVVKRTIQVRKEVLERQNWKKWGELASLQRGQHREGDMLVEQELKMQTVDGRKTDEMNFVIPAPKVFFKVEQKYEVQKEDELKSQPRSEMPQALNVVRQAGESIRFAQSDVSQNNWLLIVSNIVYFEQAESFEEVNEMKESFRGFIANLLQLEEKRDTYYINFLQNKRKNKLYNKKRDNSTFPLLQKVMLKFPDKTRAMVAEEQLHNQSFIDCVLEVELQEQRQRF